MQILWKLNNLAGGHGVV